MAYIYQVLWIIVGTVFFAAPGILFVKGTASAGQIKLVRWLGLLMAACGVLYIGLKIPP